VNQQNAFDSTMATGSSAHRSGDSEIRGVSARREGSQLPAIASAQTALIVMHYQTDILKLFLSVASALLANTRKLCGAARTKGVGVYFANLRFSPGYPSVCERRGFPLVHSEGLLLRPGSGRTSTSVLYRIRFAHYGTFARGRLAVARLDVGRALEM